MTPPIRALTAKRKMSLLYSEYFEALLTDKQPGFKVPSILEGLKFHEALSLINFLSHYHLRSKGIKFVPVSMTNKERANMYSDVWRILQDWPSRFNLLLGSYVDNPMSRRGNAGINKYFRDIHSRLYAQKSNRGLLRAKEAFDAFVDNSLPGIRQDFSVTRVNLTRTESEFVTKRDAASILNCRFAKLNGFIQQKEIMPEDVGGKLLFRKSDVLQLKGHYESNWTFTEARQFFGVSRHQMDSLLKSNIVHALKIPSSLNRDWLVDRAQCEELLQSLIEGACDLVAPPSGWTSLAGIQRRYPIDKLIPRMLDGNIQYIRSREKTAGFQQFSNFLVT